MNPLKSPADIVLGIDLGSSTSAVAYCDPVTKALRVVGPNVALTNQKEFKSLAGFNELGRIITCAEAEKNFLNKNCRVFSNLKRALVENTKFEYGGVTHRPLYLLAQILKTMKKAAQVQIGHTVNKVVLAVPAYFQQIHKESLRKAATLAGLNVLKLINEPTAALLCYNHNRSSSKIQEKILIIDAGGFTFDASLCMVDNAYIDVISTHGDYRAGHKMIDEFIKNRIIDHYTKKFYHSAELTQLESKKLDQCCEELKIKLSALDKQSETVTVPLNPSFNFTFTRSQLLDGHKEYLNKIRRVIATTLNKNESPPNRILFVGGPARSKMLVQLLEEILPHKLDLSLDALHSVAKGAALHGYYLTEGKGGGGQVLFDVIPISLGVEKLGRYCHKMLYKNSKIPCSHTQVFTTYEDYQTSVKIKILQGEQQMSESCVLLGTILLDNIELGKKGIPKLVVHFEVNSSGTLTVTAEDSRTKVKKKLNLQCENRISEHELQDLIKYDKENEQEDKSHTNKLQLIKDAQLLYVELAQLHNRLTALNYGESYVEELSNTLSTLEEELKKYPKNYVVLLQLIRSSRALIEEIRNGLPPSSNEYLSLAQ